MPVEIAKIKLPHIHRITTLEQTALVYHRIPGLEGNLAQDLGRESVRLQIEGIFYGPKAADDLEALRKIYKKREAVDFLADVVGQAYFGKVTLDRFEVAEVAGEPEQFSYSLTVVEYVQPPSPATTKPTAQVSAAIKVKAKDFMQIASLPDSLTGGSLPAVTNPAEPLKGAAEQITNAGKDVQGVASGLQGLLTLKVEKTAAPTLPDEAGQVPPSKPLEWVKPTPLPVTSELPPGATTASGSDGKPLLDSTGKPIMAKPLLGADGQPVLGPNGQPLLTTLEGNSLPLPGGKPVAGADGKLLVGADGKPILSTPAPKKPDSESGQPPGAGDGENSPDSPKPPASPSFAFIELLDEDGQPVAGEAFELKLADGSLKTGKLDSKGQARVAGVSGQHYRVRFPNLDKTDWSLAPDPAANIWPIGTAIIELLDEDGQPLAGESWLLTFADSSTRTGVLDAQGQARLTDLPDQTFRLTFPNLDSEDWS